MSKVVKLAISIFVGVDIFVLMYLLFSQGRMALFGTGDIPGGGSALDMALFLIPAFIGYVAGDRLYHFLSYNKQRPNPVVTPANSETPAVAEQQPGQPASNTIGKETIWQDADWDDTQADLPAKDEANLQPAQPLPRNKAG